MQNIWNRRRTQGFVRAKMVNLLRLSHDWRSLMNYILPDTIPDHIDDIYEQLEDASANEVSAILGRLNYQEAGWLARLIREKVVKEREQSHDEFESELNVRTFNRFEIGTDVVPLSVRAYVLLVKYAISV
jgi:hypothetical protein